jgi:hypothetical protein
MSDTSGGHPEYLRALDEMRALHLRKAADYGRGADSLANVRAAEEFGVPAWVGAMLRANDKVHRVKSYLQNGSLKNEGVEDSLMDLAAYAIIALVLFREGRPGSAKAAAGPKPEWPAGFVPPHDEWSYVGDDCKCPSCERYRQCLSKS